MHESIQYFKSCAGRGKFVRLLGLQPDKRFVNDTALQQAGSSTQFGALKGYQYNETVSYIRKTINCTYMICWSDNVYNIGHVYIVT